MSVMYLKIENVTKLLNLIHKRKTETCCQNNQSYKRRGVFTNSNTVILASAIDTETKWAFVKNKSKA